MSDVLPDPKSAFGARVRARLRDDTLIWLTTTSADGTPQPSPVWFLWDEAGSVLIYSAVGARRLDHIRARPRVAMHFDADGSGGDIVVLLGRAHIDDDIPAPTDNDAYRAKYGDAMARVSGDIAQFASVYRVPVVVVPDRVRGFLS